MITVCSGFSPNGYNEYGKRFLETFSAFWPASIGLRVYTEAPVDVPRGKCVDVMVCDGLAAFVAKHERNAAARGREPSARWKDGERAAGYSYKWDAHKFIKQLVIPADAARELPDGDTLVWLDADVVSFAPVSANLIPSLLGDADLCYLGRGKKHSEIGFWAVRLNAHTRAFLQELADTYTQERVFALSEWHSAFVFDHVRRKYADAIKQRDITPGGSGHVWFQSPLGTCTDHCKGARKKLVRSAERRS